MNTAAHTGPTGYFPGYAWQLQAEAAVAQECAESDHASPAAAAVSAPSPPPGLPQINAGADVGPDIQATVGNPIAPSPVLSAPPSRGVTVTTLDPSCMETLALVRLIVTHPDVWPGFAHDFLGEPEDFVPPWLGQRQYMIAAKNKKVIGMFLLSNFQYGIWIGHWAFFPWAKGRDVRIAAQMGIKTMWERPDCWTIVGLTPACNKAALWSSRRVGFTRVGVLPSATRIGGKWFDLIVSQVTKPL